MQYTTNKDQLDSKMSNATLVINSNTMKIANVVVAIKRSVLTNLHGKIGGERRLEFKMTCK